MTIEYPLISAIMPTTGKRRRFVEQSIKLFNAQDYPNKELIIVDEADYYGNSCIDVWQPQSNIEYLFIDTLGTEATLTIGAKRNLACSLAKGSIICHWDDDDYYGPERLSKQVAPILAGEADVTGMYMSLLLRMADTTLWTCSIEMHRVYFPYGIRCGTLMYGSQYLYAGKLSYDNVSHGEDVGFLQSMFLSGSRLAAVTDAASYICVRHGDNVTNDIVDDKWQQVPLSSYLSEQDSAFYASLHNNMVVVQ